MDHALLIASKVAGALEYAHGRKNDAGARTFHGLLAPATVVVSYEGEVRLKSFGYWPSRVREGQLLLEAERRHLAPEQAGGGLGDTRSDIFGLGAILFETLTGQPPTPGVAAPELVGSARLTSPAGDDDAVPKPLAEILQKALASDPGARYADIAEMRKAIDTLLFSGDFTPTTFNLAFFMHSLFREDMERETKALKEEREAQLRAVPDRRAGAARSSTPGQRSARREDRALRLQAGRAAAAGAGSGAFVPGDYARGDRARLSRERLRRAFGRRAASAAPELSRDLAQGSRGQLHFPQGGGRRRARRPSSSASPCCSCWPRAGRTPSSRRAALRPPPPPPRRRPRRFHPMRSPLNSG